MISKERFGDSLLSLGLLLAIFIGFETLIGMSLKYQTIVVDSTYIVALVDVAVLSLGIAFHPKKVLDENVKTEDKTGTVSFQLGGLLLAIFLFSGYLLLSAIPTIAWEGVYWFDPPLNFQLIREQFKINLFVSIFMMLVLAVMLSLKDSKIENN